MKLRMLKPICALLLAVTILLTPMTTVFTARALESARLSVEDLLSEPESAITRGEFVMLVNNALMIFDDYEGEQFADVSDDHPFAADILRAKVLGIVNGDGTGNFYPDAVISGAQAAALICNLLGFDGSLVEAADANVPRWALPAVSVLIDLTITDAATLEKPELAVADAIELVTALAIATMFPGSPYALSQAAPQDDYYAYINRQVLATGTIPAGYMIGGSFVDTIVEVDSQLQEVLGDILSGSSWEEGSDEWLIVELFERYMDNETRTGLLSKVQPLIDEVNEADSIGDLLKVAKKYAKYLDLQPYYVAAINRDAKVDATSWCTIIMPGSLDLGSREYYADDESLIGVQMAYVDYLAALLSYAGESDNLAARAEALFAIEKERASIMLPTEAYSGDAYLIYTDVTWAQMLELTSTTGTLLLLDDFYEIAKDRPIYCAETDYVEFIESLYVEKNLRTLKDVAMINIVSAFAAVLGDDLSKLSTGLIEALYGSAGEAKSAEQRAQDFVTSMMWQTFSNAYAEHFSSKAIKDDVADIVEDIRDKYRERIMALNWMSEETKLAAVDKLDSIAAFVAFSDEPVAAAAFDTSSLGDNWDLVDYYLGYLDAEYAEAMEMIKRPYELNLWDHIPASEVNAFYVATENAIIIPAGILQGVFYDLDAPREQNLGGIGIIIAHEFTHAFDNTGAEYDKYGTLKNWWTDEDYAAFGLLTLGMADAISGIAFLGDYYVNGALTTGEAIADLGAVACVFDILDDSSDNDLVAAMASWAAVWASRMSPEIVVYLLFVDSHLPDKLRTNFILAQFEEFYEAYGVVEGDGMFIPEDARLAIW